MEVLPTRARSFLEILSRLRHGRYEPEFVEPIFTVKEQLEALGYLGGD